MTKTEHYNLCQWDAADPIRREDFNNDNAAIDAALGEKGNCRIAVGSYVGTGTYGANNPSTLTFDFQPKFVLIQLEGAFLGKDVSNMACFYPWTLSKTASSGSPTVYLTWGENSLSWYAPDGVGYQLNVENSNYWYIAVG